MQIEYETSLSAPMKVKCDATKKFDQNGICSIGYVVQNHNGRVIDRGGRNIGNGYTVTEAEFVAMGDAVQKLAREDGCQHLVVYTDSTKALKSTGGLRETFGDSFESLSFEWVPREDNYDADIMAEYHSGSLGENENRVAFGATD